MTKEKMAYELAHLLQDICDNVWRDSKEMIEEDFKDVLTGRLIRFKQIVDSEDI